jgi:CDP-diacylglycerol--glycerol-3-phosphate 3-phosphatidyltransferase
VNLSSTASSDPGPVRQRWWTVPNVLTVFRWVGSLLLIYLGWNEQPLAFAIWYLVLAVTDFVDGRIAVYFHQRTELGARLDSVADATLYLSVVIGGMLLWHDALLGWWPWIALACGSYGVATLYGLAKFGRWPSYHTWTAKGSWPFVMAAIVCLAWNLPLWPLALGMVAVTLANLESIAITHLLKRWRNDVPSVFKIKNVEQ